MLKDVLIETWRKKSLGRIFLNNVLHQEIGKLDGRVLDIGGGGQPSYERYIDFSQASLETLNMDEKRTPTYLHDLNAPLPMEDNRYDAVLCINVLYCLPDPQKCLREIRRVLKPQGRLFLTYPFMFNESPEPEDFSRFTSLGLRRLVQEAGFQNIRILPMGGRAIAAETLLDASRLFYPVRVIFRIWAIFKDRVIFKKLNARHPAPYCFFAVGSK